MQAGQRRCLRAIVQDCQRWLADASNNRFRSQTRQMADRLSDLESFLMCDVEEARGRAAAAETSAEQAAAQALLAEMLRELLPLADSLASFAGSAVSTIPDSPCNPDCVPPPPGRQRDLWAANWTGTLHDAAMLFGLVTTCLDPAWFEDADFQRLLAATAVVVSAGGLGCQRLAELCLHEQQQHQLGADSISSEVAHVDDCVSRHLSVMTDLLNVLEQPGTLLHPSRVLPWLQQMLPVIRWIDELEGASSLETPLAWPKLFCSLLRLPQHADALCGDAALCSELASLTAASHAACIAAPQPADKTWVDRHGTIAYSLSSWRVIVPTGGQQAPGLLPLQAAAGSILHSEVALLHSLPVQPAADAGQEGPGTDLLLRCWESSVEAAGSCTSLLLQPAGGAQVPPARAQRVLHAVASSAPAVTRFVAAAAGSQQVTAALASSMSLRFISQLTVWSSGIGNACDTRARGLQAAAAATPGSDALQLEDMQRELGMAAGLLHSLLRLLAQLPPLAAAIADARAAQGRPSNLRCQHAAFRCLGALSSACTLLGAVSGACSTQRAEAEEQAAPHLPKLLRAHAGCCQLAHALLALEEREQEALGMRDENNALTLVVAVLQISNHVNFALPPRLLGERSAPEQEQLCRTRVGLLLATTAAIAPLLPHVGSLASGLTMPDWCKGHTSRDLAIGLLACHAPPSPNSVSSSSSAAPAGSVEREAGEEAALAKLAQELLHSPSAAALLPALLQRLLPPRDPASGSDDEGAGSSTGDASCSGASNAAGASTAWPVLCEEAEVLQAQALAQRGVCCNMQCPHLSLAAGYRTKACGRCRLVRYCCAACQRADYPGHRVACKALARAAPAVVGGSDAAAEAAACQ